MLLSLLITFSFAYYFVRARARKRIGQETKLNRSLPGKPLRDDNPDKAPEKESIYPKTNWVTRYREFWIPDLIGEITWKLIASAILIHGAMKLAVPGDAISYVVVMVPISIVGILWVGPFLDYTIGKMVNSIYGLGQKIEPHAKYDQAESKWKMGFPHEAIKMVDEQLVEFPEDYEGQWLKAQIQMESLRDFASAEATLLAIASQKKHGAGKVVGVHKQLADWYFKVGDQETGKTILLGLCKSYPNSQIEFNCSQRIARLDFSLDSNDPRDAGDLVSLCLKQLGQHPLDNSTREQLARIYFDRCEKPDLARQEIGKLLSNQFQHPKDISRWLSLMADWHLKEGDLDGARGCLQQIMSRYPDLPYYEQAQDRLTRMKDM